MKTPWTKVVAATAIVCAAPASAIPVTFDFTGTVRQTWDINFDTGEEIYDAGPVGTAFSAQFIIDTDLFGPPVSSQTVHSDRIVYSSLLSGAITSNLVINGAAVNLAPFSTNTAFVGFADSRGVIEDEDGSRSMATDQWSVALRSEEITPLGRTGLLNLSFGFASIADFSHPTGGPGWFDFSPGIDLDSIATLPMQDTFGGPLGITLSESRYGCAEECMQSGISTTWLTVSSVTRTVSSVPEPGALGLLAIGLAGAGLTRRRQAQRA